MVVFMAIVSCNLSLDCFLELLFSLQALFESPRLLHNNTLSKITVPFKGLEAWI